MSITTQAHISSVFPEAYGGDGYDAIEAAQQKGWVVFSGWGEDGWDAGDWPLVFIALRHTGPGHPDRKWQTLEYVEGDITIREFTLRGDAIARLDSVVHWHWKHSSHPFSDPDIDFDQPRYKGPFTWHRLCLKDGEPRCKQCQVAGEVQL